MKQEKLYFKNSKGDKLCGILSNPTDSTDCPIVILCHGFTTSKDNHTNTALEKILNDVGIAIFRFDFFAHGESEGEFAEITVSEGVDDILQAISFIKSLGYSKIALEGGSYGGSTTLMATSKSSDVYALALKAPVSNWKDRILHKDEKEVELWKEKGWRTHINGVGKKFRLNYTFYEDFDNNDGYKAAPGVNIPTFIVHGDKDQSVPVQQSIKLNQILPSSTLEIIKGADHNFSNEEHFNKMVDLISSFLIEHLK